MVPGYSQKHTKLCCLLFTMASHTRDLMYKNEKLFWGILDERTAGLLLDANTESLGSDMTLGERDRNPNDEIHVPVPSPTAITATREELSVNFGLVICN